MPSVPLKEYVESLILGVKEAVSKAEDALNRRLEGMNEIRASMVDQASRFASKEAVEALAKQVQEIRETLAGGATTTTLFKFLGGAVVGGLVAYYFKP